MNLKRLLIKWYFRYLSVLAKSYFSVSCRDVYLGRHVQIIGIKNVEIGKGSTLGDFFWLNVNHRDQRKRVRIGNYSNIGRNNFFTVGEELIIGDYFLSSCYCSIIGASHKNDDPFTPYVISGVTSGSSIKIGCNVFMGAHSMVIGGVNIGFGSIIGAGGCCIIFSVNSIKGIILNGIKKP